MAFGMRFGILLLLAAQGLLARQASLGEELQRAGLVDIQRLDRSLRVELKYSTTDNFMHADVYGDLDTCYLQREVAEMLVKAQTLLKMRHPGFSLKVFDGARPRRVQVIMWNIVKGTDQQKYVTSPANGSIHNYGSAVDLTITDAHGDDLDMGTPYDFLGELAQPRYEERFLAAGKLTKAQVERRILLRNTMISAGFTAISNEWWHFDAFSRSEAKQRYEILE
jgi:D-alanyl-D-alanine dipeptidase